MGDNLTGYAQTVLGTVHSKDLGPTSTHEHLLIDFTCMFTPPSVATDFGIKTPIQDRTCQLSAFNRVGCLTRPDHLDNLVNQTGGVCDVWTFREEELRGLQFVGTPEARRESIIADSAVQHQQRRLQSVIAFNEVSSRVFDQLAEVAIISEVLGVLTVAVLGV